MTERVSNKRGTTHRRGTKPARSFKTSARHQAKQSRIANKQKIRRIVLAAQEKERQDRKRKEKKFDYKPPKLALIDRMKKLWRQLLTWRTTS